MKKITMILTLLVITLAAIAQNRSLTPAEFNARQRAKQVEEFYAAEAFNARQRAVAAAQSGYYYGGGYGYYAAPRTYSYIPVVVETYPVVPPPPVHVHRHATVVDAVVGTALLGVTTAAIISSAKAAKHERKAAEARAAEARANLQAAQQAAEAKAPAKAAAKRERTVADDIDF